MTTVETVLIVIALVLIFLVIGNLDILQAGGTQEPAGWYVHPMRWRTSPLH